MNFISYCIFNNSTNSQKRVGARINNTVIDLSLLSKLGFLESSLEESFNFEFLNKFIALPLDKRKQIKKQLFALEENFLKKATLKLEEVHLHLPVEVKGFTDFYVSKNHAINIGSIFRPQNPLMPNWEHMPIGYNGRASSIVSTNHPVIRPRGQILVNETPELNHSKKLDFEVEIGVIIGKDSTLGQPIKIENASEYIFGICILNDWSARDIQQWEYQPLGPFNSKGFLTSISPFIIPIEELEAFKISAPAQSPKPLSYLLDKELYSYDISLNVTLKTAKYQEGITISKTNFKYAYWTINQWIAQHTVAGCNLRIGDIIASGTLSGETRDSCGSLMEITKNGKEPLTLPNGETRTFLENGDELIISGYCANQNNIYDIGTTAGIVTE